MRWRRSGSSSPQTRSSSCRSATSRTRLWVTADLVSRRSFVALQHRNFRLLWIGLFVSFSGSMMQNAALLWHVSLLVSPERKGLALGLVGLVRVMPIIVFSLISGVVADAWDRRKLMLFTQAAATATAL